MLSFGWLTFRPAASILSTFSFCVMLVIAYVAFAPCFPIKIVGTYVESVAVVPEFHAVLTFFPRAPCRGYNPVKRYLISFRPPVITSVTLIFAFVCGSPIAGPDVPSFTSFSEPPAASFLVAVTVFIAFELHIAKFVAVLLG